MGVDVERELASLDPEALLRRVRQVLGQEVADLNEWEYRPIYTGLGAAIASSAVYRLSGTGRLQSRTLPWSLILKVLYRPIEATDSVSRPVTGWDREVLTFRSGLLDHLPAGLAAPRCFGIDDHADSIWLWLEDIAEDVGPRWPLARFSLAARHLGRFNGQHLNGRPLPTDAWLSRTVLRQRAERNSWFWTNPAAATDPPTLQRLFPNNLLGRARSVWEERYRLLDVLDQLPHTLVHGDADRRNLFARRTPSGADETVAIDWAWTGIAAIGEELVNLVSASAMWHQVVLDDLLELSHECFNSYVAGLADAGWRGDSRFVQIGFAIGTALRYGPLGPFAIILRHPELRDAMTRATGISPERTLDVMAEVQRFGFDQLDGVRDYL